jgi:hypothetical protein
LFIVNLLFALIFGFGRIFCFAKNRAFRSNSSKMPEAFLRDFHFNPLRGITSGKTGCDEEAPSKPEPVHLSSILNQRLFREALYNGWTMNIPALNGANWRAGWRGIL